jgi:hypothetical protein
MGKMLMRYLLFFWILFDVAGCISQRTVLVNERGEETTCEITGWGAFPALVASNKQNECIAEAERRGYHVKEQKGDNFSSP